MVVIWFRRQNTQSNPRIRTNFSCACVFADIEMSNLQKCFGCVTQSGKPAPLLTHWTARRHREMFFDPKLPVEKQWSHHFSSNRKLSLAKACANRPLCKRWISAAYDQGTCSQKCARFVLSMVYSLQLSSLSHDKNFVSCISIVQKPHFFGVCPSKISLNSKNFPHITFLFGKINQLHRLHFFSTLTWLLQLAPSINSR